MDDMNRFFIGLILGIMVCACVVGLTKNPTKHYNELLENCEKRLPRDQHCVIIAVPANTD